LPIEINKSNRGALNIYANGVDVFTDEGELRLLKELAGDLALGISTIRTREEKRKAELERRKNQQKYRLLFNKMQEGFTLIEKLPGKLDEEERFKFVETNPAFEQLTGFPGTEVIGKTIDEKFPELARVWDQVRKDDEYDQGPFLFEYFSNITGKTYLINVNRIQKNKHAAFFIDISKQKLGEKQVQISEMRMRKALDNMTAMITIYDPEKNITYANRAAMTFSSNSQNKMIGKTDREVWPVPLKEVLNTLLDQTIQTHESQSKEVDLHIPNIGRKVLLISYVPLRDQKNDVKDIMCIMVDLTEQRSSEEKIKKQLQRLNGLHKIDISISGSLELSIILEEILNQCMQQLNVDAVRILSFNTATNTLEIQARRGFKNSSRRADPIGQQEFSMRVIKKRENLFLPNIADEKSNIPKEFDSEGFQAYFGALIYSKGLVKGVLEVFKRETFRPDQEWENFLVILAGQAAISIESIEQYEKLIRLNDELRLAYERTLEGWSSALDLRDKDTEGHTLRVTQLTLQLAKEFKLSEEELIHIRRGALLHDIGKMGIPDSILHKPGPLLPEERKVIEQHPIFAFNLISPIKFLIPALEIPYCHHEKWDGSGYPRGLKAQQIPLAARIFAVIDVWDALRSDRQYRKAWSEEETIDYIKNESGKHFDPHVVDVFLENYTKYTYEEN
jgi:PAS domain S-box-containing protein/putative nucleotidyltransferase with HDIG domain